MAGGFTGGEIGASDAIFPTEVQNIQVYETSLYTGLLRAETGPGWGEKFLGPSGQRVAPCCCCCQLTCETEAGAPLSQGPSERTASTLGRGVAPQNPASSAPAQGGKALGLPVCLPGWVQPRKLSRE